MIGKVQEPILYPSGAPASREDVLVVLAGTTTPADIKTAAGTPLDNPILTDQYGNLSFFVEQGTYDLIVNGARITIEVTPTSTSGGGQFQPFTSPAATWTWQHNLGYRPTVLLFADDNPNTPVFTDLEYPDENTIVVEWDRPTTGRIYA